MIPFLLDVQVRLRRHGEAIPAATSIERGARARGLPPPSGRPRSPLGLCQMTPKRDRSLRVKGEGRKQESEFNLQSMYPCARQFFVRMTKMSRNAAR